MTRDCDRDCEFVTYHVVCLCSQERGGGKEWEDMSGRFKHIKINFVLCGYLNLRLSKVIVFLKLNVMKSFHLSYVRQNPSPEIPSTSSHFVEKPLNST